MPYTDAMRMPVFYRTNYLLIDVSTELHGTNGWKTMAPFWGDICSFSKGCGMCAKMAKAQVAMKFKRIDSLLNCWLAVPIP